MSEYVKCTIQERIMSIMINRGKSNAMHTPLIEELLTIILDCKENPSVEGVILTGNEGFFSSGLDLITLYQYDEEQMKQLWSVFLDLVEELICFPKPLVSAISGHSPAGGCVLALTADARIMAEGDFIIGLNEIPVGIVVPNAIFELYSFWVGKAVAYRYLLEGKLLKPNEALESGVVDELVPMNRLQSAATIRIKIMMQYEKSVWSTTKQNIRNSLIESFKKDQKSAIDQVLEQWWKPSTRNLLKTIIDNLTHKKSD